MEPCSVCGVASALHCGRCLAAYCSPAHQIEAWPRHRHVCVAPSPLRAEELLGACSSCAGASGSGSDSDSDGDDAGAFGSYDSDGDSDDGSLDAEADDAATGVVGGVRAAAQRGVARVRGSKQKGVRRPLREALLDLVATVAVARDCDIDAAFSERAPHFDSTQHFVTPTLLASVQTVDFLASHTLADMHVDTGAGALSAAARQALAVAPHHNVRDDFVALYTAIDAALQAPGLREYTLKRDLAAAVHASVRAIAAARAPTPKDARARSAGVNGQASMIFERLSRLNPLGRLWMRADARCGSGACVRPPAVACPVNQRK